jgi:two-component system, chemotaxis family, chemotaxis protein CheY
VHTQSRGVVLIVEEHGAVRTLFAITLRDAGFQAVEADSFDSAFALALEHRPHAVLAACDSALDGIELARTLASHAGTRTIPVILLAGSAQQDLGLMADDAWIHTVLSKPCPQEELLAQVTQAVAYSFELRQILALAPSRPAQVPPENATGPTHAPRSDGHGGVAVGARSGGTEFSCPTCGEPALSILGETRHSVILRCSACHDVSVERRR